MRIGMMGRSAPSNASTADCLVTILTQLDERWGSLHVLDQRRARACWRSYGVEPPYSRDVFDLGTAIARIICDSR